MTFKTIVSILFLALIGCTKSDPPCNKSSWYIDRDGDGLGDSARSIVSCEAPQGYVSNSSDPDDFNIAAKIEQGIQQEFLSGATPTKYGFYLYTPSSYNDNESEHFPLLVFLHGGGARGNSAITPEDLVKVLWDGPPKLIKDNNWNPTHPMIVVSPQSPTQWVSSDLHDFIAYLNSMLKVDTSRIYMTGFSMGGKGCYDYISDMGEDAYIIAMVSIAGWGDTSSGDQFTETALWAFHGSADDVIAPEMSIDMVEAINSANPNTRAKLTIYPGVEHDSWSRTFDGSGMGNESPDYDPFDMDIYDWMYTFKK